MAFTDAGGRNLEHRDDSEPRPQRSVERLVWLAHGLTVMVAWLVAVPFVLIFVAVGFIMEALFGMPLQHSNDSDGTDLARCGFDEAQENVESWYVGRVGPSPEKRSQRKYGSRDWYAQPHTRYQTAERPKTNDSPVLSDTSLHEKWQMSYHKQQ